MAPDRLVSLATTPKPRSKRTPQRALGGAGRSNAEPLQDIVPPPLIRHPPQAGNGASAGARLGTVIHDAQSVTLASIRVLVRPAPSPAQVPTSA